MFFLLQSNCSWVTNSRFFYIAASESEVKFADYKLADPILRIEIPENI